MSNIVFYDREEFQKELKRLENHPKRGYFCSVCNRYWMVKEDPMITERPHLCTRCRLERLLKLGGI